MVVDRTCASAGDINIRDVRVASRRLVGDKDVACYMSPPAKTRL